MKYLAILFAPDGEYVTDFERDTKQEVWDEVNNMGSRWIFYPIAFVGTQTTIVDTQEDANWLKGKRIKTVQRFFKKHYEKHPEIICQGINEGYPLDIIYTI